MTKRRRERDRPKAAPDAVYDPNKRIQLSYDSEDEGDGGPAQMQVASSIVPTDNASMLRGRVSDPRSGWSVMIGRVEEELLQSDEDNQGAQYLAIDSDHNHQGVSQQDTSMRPRDKTKKKKKDKSEDTNGHKRRALKMFMADEVTGQRPMFDSACLQEELDEDLEIDESMSSDAMAYLMSVRSERQDIPDLLTAPQVRDPESVYTTEYDDQQDQKGIFTDGVYAARPFCGPVKPAEEDDHAANILAGFVQTRQLLEEPLTSAEKDASDDTTFIHYVPFLNKEFRECLRVIQDTAPAIAQLKDMDTDTAWDLLTQLITRLCLPKYSDISQNVAWWVYMLLARLEEPDELFPEQFSALRELATTAVALRTSLDDRNVANDDGDQAATTTQITVDTLLIIIGDFFRQRDLLELRAVTSS